MENFSKSHINTFARSLKDLTNNCDNAMEFYDSFNRYIPEISDFLYRIDHNSRIRLSDIVDSYSLFFRMYDTLKSLDIINYSKEDLDDAISRISKSIDYDNPNTYDSARFHNASKIFIKSSYHFIKNNNQFLFILDDDALKNYARYFRPIIASQDIIKRVVEKQLKKYSDLRQTIVDATDCEKNRMLISNDMKDYLIELMDDVYYNWRDKWDLENIIERYNDEIERQHQSQKKSIAPVKYKINNIEEKPKAISGYQIRIDELINYFDIDTLKNKDVLTEKEMALLIKHTTNNDLAITDNNIVVLDSLLYINKELLLKELSRFKEPTALLYLNLLLRTFVIKKKYSELKHLIGIINDIEIACFNPINYLKSANRSEDVTFINNFKQYMNLLQHDKDPQLSLIQDRYDDLKFLVYCFANDALTEEDYIEELGKYYLLLNSGLNLNGNVTDSDVIEFEAQNDKNILCLLTDNDDISFAEKNILNDITKVSDQAIAFDKIIRLENIDIHKDIDGHICKNESYDEELLKSCHFKSANCGNSRIYYGAFTNSNREKLVIIYGIRTGNMDNNSKTRYYKEVINNQLKPNEDYIMGIIDAFNNDKIHFEKYIAKSEEAKDHFKNTLKENGYKFENVNTLEME